MQSCRHAVAAISQPSDTNESDSDDNIYQENGKISNGYELFIPYIESKMDKSSDNADVSHLPETCEELPKPSNQDESSNVSDLQSFLYDEEVYDTNLQSSLKKWAVKHGCTRQCINDLLIILNESRRSLPKDSRTLLKTDQNATNTTLFNGEYTYFGVRNTIEKIVTTKNYTDRKINLMVSTDGLPQFESNSL